MQHVLRGEVCDSYIPVLELFGQFHRLVDIIFALVVIYENCQNFVKFYHQFCYI